MHCPYCQAETIRYGRTAAGHQRHRCKACGRTVTESPEPSPIAPMRLPFDRAVLVLSLLTEGMSIRSAERITGHHRDTICRLLVLEGGKCERLLESLVEGVEVENVQADELWSFVGKKERTKAMQRDRDPFKGDCYTFVALERDSKLVLAHHVGRRTGEHTDLFVEKLARATAGRFQVTTDGWVAYPEAISYHLGERTDYATLVKEYASDPEGQRSYSPPRIIATTKAPVHGYPVEAEICTSHVERHNLTTRMSCRRFGRLTNAFSKKWANHRAAVALHMASYNLCRMHSSIRMTPAMKAGVANRPWSVADLLAA